MVNFRHFHHRGKNVSQNFAMAKMLRIFWHLGEMVRFFAIDDRESRENPNCFGQAANGDDIPQTF